MKSMKTNVGSFATAKLQAKMRSILAILAIMLVFTMTTVGCGNDSTDNNTPDNTPKPITFISTDTAGKTYTLIITPGTANTVAAGDSYELTITETGQPDKVSKGTITNITSDNKLTMKPTNSEDPFEITVSNGQMTEITGPIAVEGAEEPVTAPGTLTPATAVTFTGVTANGSSTQTTTQLTLAFSQAITGLSASDITLSGVSGIIKGTLSGSGPSYTLPISGFTAGGTVTVAVAKEGYNISGSPKTATVYYYSGGGGGNPSDFTYYEYQGKMYITGYTGAGGDVNIPAQINGIPVTDLTQQSFSNKKDTLTGITIPDIRKTARFT